jgi:apolipoprotein N-acyltransferase
LTEYLRGLIFTGFPWNLIGYATHDIPYFPQIADILGVYGVSFCIILVVAFLCSKKTIVYGILTLLMVLGYSFVTIQFKTYLTSREDQALVRLVQPSIEQEDKMSPQKEMDNLNKLITVSIDTTLSHGRPKLIVWPEAAINITSASKNAVLKYIANKLDLGAGYLITGCDRIEPPGILYNGLCIVNQNGEIIETYDKRHLLPFGEFIPEILLKLDFKKLCSGITNYSGGVKANTIALHEVPMFSTNICYEIVFPGKIVDDASASWILNISNDAWFKKTDGPSQHMRVARFRAIEEGKPILRCTNNGISCVIDSFGNAVDILDTDEVGYIDTYLPDCRKTTLFSKYGNKIIICLILAIFVLLFFLRKRNRLQFKVNDN